MKKYRIRIIEDGKYYLEYKKKGRFFESGWKKIDYFYSLESADAKLEEIAIGVKILKETDWIR